MTDAVLWVLGQEGTEQGPRTSCTGCELDEIFCFTCPVELDEVPEGVGEARRFMELYGRCVAYHALPGPGAVEDQVARDMRILDLIGQLVAEHEKAKRAQDEARDAAWKKARGTR